MSAGGFLPAGWADVELQDVVRTSSGGTPASKNPGFYGGDVPWVKIGDLTEGPVERTEQTITREGLGSCSAKLLPTGTVLIAMYGSIGKLGILTAPAATNQAICAMQPSEAVDRDYLFWFLMAQRSYLVSLGRGGTQQNIGQANLKSLRIPLPPIAEQKHIVGEIERYLSDINHGIKSLGSARDGLQSFRRSVLQEAVGSCVVPPTQRASDGGLPPLPRSWEWSTVADEGTVQLGRMLNKDRSSGPHMQPYLRVANVLDDHLDLTVIKEMDFPPAEYERYLLHPGDILLNEGQSPELLGRAAMYRGEQPGLCFQKALLRFQAGPRVNREFALLVFRHYLYSGRFRRESRITTGIGHLTQERFAAMEFPVPPRAEQGEIVRWVRQQLVTADHLDRVLDKAEEDAVTLKSSLLHAAFSGDLSPRMLDDQPAGALLADVQEFRTANGLAVGAGEIRAVRS
jgi:type I restriction enzyme S subunit